MATYQAGVTDYISQIQPTEPNLAFDAQILQAKQSKFDANHKKISELYGSLLNSSMSRNQNIAARDEFFKKINGDIIQMAGMDFSLDENVDAAANVFQSIYNNKNIVKDMVWTSNFQNQQKRGEAFKNCVDPEKCGGQWWEGGDKYMGYKLQEFKDATNDEAMNFEDVEYVPYTNMLDKAMKYAKDNKLEITTDQLVGNYMVTTKNGPQAYGPLAELFTNLYANDPKLLKQYEAQAYVNRKDNVSAIMTETGMDENAATSEYIRRQGTAQQERINEILNESNADEDYIKGRMEILEDKLKTGNFGKESSVAKEYEALQQLLPGAQQASEYIKLAKNSAENANNNTYIRAIGKNLDARDAAIFMHNDINGAAKSIADNTMTQKQEADDFAKLKVAHQYDLMLENAKQANRIALEGYKATLDGSSGSNPFGKGKDGKKLDSDKTVTGYIDDKYKSQYGDKKIKGDYSDKLEALKKKRDEAIDDEKEHKGYDEQIKRLEVLNNENILRKKVQALDQSNIKPAFGNSFGEIYAKDKEMSNRTADKYDSKALENARKNNKLDKYGYSKTLGAVYGNMNGSNQEYHTPEEVNKQIQENDGKRTIKAKDIKQNPVVQKQAIDYINNSGLPLASDTIKKIVEQKNPVTISNTAKKIKNAESKKLVKSADVDKNMIAFVANNHSDPKVKATYQKLAKKNVNDLSPLEKKNIKAKYENLKGEKSFVMTGFQTVSNQTVAQAYNKHFSNLNGQIGFKTAIVNKGYVETLKKDSPEYKVLQKQALQYIKKHGVNTINKMGSTESFEQQRIAQQEKESGVKYKKPVQTYKIAKTVYKDNEISHFGLINLIENDKGFSRYLYNSNVKNKLAKSNTPVLEELKAKPEIQNAIYTIESINEDLTNHINLKKEKHNAIVLKTKEGGDYKFGFNKEYIKNGSLISKDEFLRKNSFRFQFNYKNEIDQDAREEVLEEYQTYTKHYHDALNLTLKKSNGVRSGVGPATYNRYEANNIHMYSDLSPATNEAKSFIANFNQTSPNAKKLFVNGQPIEDKAEIQKYISNVMSSKNFMNMSYQMSRLSGLNDFEGKSDWEGVSFYDKKTNQTITLASDPNVNSSKMYEDRAQSTKDRSLQQTGKTILTLGNELTDGRPVMVERKKDGSIKFNGVVHLNGKNVDLNSFLYNSDKDYYDSLESYDDALGFFEDIMDDVRQQLKQK